MITEFIDLKKEQTKKVETKLTHCKQTSTDNWLEVSESTQKYNKVVHLGSHWGSWGGYKDIFACYREDGSWVLWAGIKGSEFI